MIWLPVILAAAILLTDLISGYFVTRALRRETWELILGLEGRIAKLEKHIDGMYGDNGDLEDFGK